MSRGLGKVQKDILNRIARWQYSSASSGETTDWLGWLLPYKDKSVFRAIRTLEERGLVYRICANGEEPKRQRVRRGKKFYTRLVCKNDTYVKCTPRGLAYWSENIADTQIV